MAPCHLYDSPRLEPLHAVARPFGLVSSDAQAFAARAEPRRVLRPRGHTHEARRRA
jgi:hypothetical protein